jgi:hypothetical protein
MHDHILYPGFIQLGWRKEDVNSTSASEGLIVLDVVNDPMVAVEIRGFESEWQLADVEYAWAR